MFNMKPVLGRYIIMGSGELGFVFDLSGYMKFNGNGFVT